MAGIIVRLPNDEAHFVAFDGSELHGLSLTEVSRYLKSLLSSRVPICTDEDSFNEVMDGLDIWEGPFFAAQEMADDLLDAMTDHQEDYFRLLYNGRDLDDESSVVAFLQAFKSGRPCIVRVVYRLLGGKGGFGALLRSQKGGKKTTNFDAMRDLNGRRLRHSKAVERIKTWLEKKKKEELAKQLEAGPDLPKPTPATEMLSDEFIRKLKRAEASRPSVVNEGFKRLAETSNGAIAEEDEPKKKTRQETDEKAKPAANPLDKLDWLGALGSLGELSSPDGEDDDEEGGSASGSASGSGTG